MLCPTEGDLGTKYDKQGKLPGDRGEARLLDIIEQAVSEATATVTAQNAAAWFHHSGYRVQQL